MTYYQEIQKELENGQAIMNDADENFIWTTFLRGGLFQIHIYRGEDLEIKEYKNIKSLSVAVGKLLNTGY